MTLDGFLTFLSVAIAAYALMPTTLRLRLKLTRAGPIFVSVVAFVLVLYLQFFDAFSRPCIVPHAPTCAALDLSTWTIAPSQVSFFVVLAWLGAMAFLTSNRPIAFGSLKQFQRLLKQLQLDGKYAEAVDLIEPNLPIIERALSTADGSIGFWSGKPKSGKHSDEVQSVLRTLAGDAAAVEYLALYRMEVGLQILQLKFAASETFTDRFLSSLLKHHTSELYRERSLSHYVGNNWEPYPGSLPLHVEFFNDASKTTESAYYRPIGEHLIQTLSWGGDDDYVHWLNMPPFDTDRERETDMLATAIWFFDCMVKGAAFQGERWHMWLYYFPHFVDVILERYSTDADGVDLDDEWAVRFDYYLYQIFRALLDWVELPLALPERSPHLTPDRPDASHENDNIPKSATIALSMCFMKLAKCDRVRRRFKKYIYEMVLRSAKSIRQKGGLDENLAVIVEAIVVGPYLRSDATYGEVLKDLDSAVDHILRGDVPEISARIDAEYGD